MKLGENDEILQEIQKVPIQRPSKPFIIGDIVRWKYEHLQDPDYGTLYIIVGYNSEMQEIIVTRIMQRPQEIREFHTSQLQHA
jgi:hypothetical protein